jgi:hypothetical protein
VWRGSYSPPIADSAGEYSDEDYRSYWSDDCGPNSLHHDSWETPASRSCECNDRQRRNSDRDFSVKHRGQRSRHDIVQTRDEFQTRTVQAGGNARVAKRGTVRCRSAPKVTNFTRSPSECRLPSCFWAQAGFQVDYLLFRYLTRATLGATLDGISIDLDPVHARRAAGPMSVVGNIARH